MIMQNIDKLTGVYLQKYFENRMKEELARSNRYKRPLTLILFELNYNYYVKNGDIRWSLIYTIMKQFGSILLRQLRNVDIAGRYGGEMFAILLPETSLEGGKVAADRIRRIVEGHIFIGDDLNREIRVALDAGLSSYPIHGKTSQELISSSHQALLIAKNEGGNRIIVCPNQLYDEYGNSLLIIEDKKIKKKKIEDLIEKSAPPEKLPKEELVLVERVWQEQPSESEKLRKLKEARAAETKKVLKERMVVFEKQKEEKVEVKEEELSAQLQPEKEKPVEKIEEKIAAPEEKPKIKAPQEAESGEAKVEAPSEEDLKEAIEKKKAEIRKAMEARIKLRKGSS